MVVQVTNLCSKVILLLEWDILKKKRQHLQCCKNPVDKEFLLKSKIDKHINHRYTQKQHTDRQTK